MKRPAQIKVGRYGMFYASVEVWVDFSSDSSTASPGWTETGFGKIVVGAKGKIWSQVYRGLLHEAMEWGMLLGGCHYCPSGALAPVADDSYLMVMSHPQFTRVANEVGDFMAHAAPELEKVWRKNKGKGERR